MTNQQTDKNTLRGTAKRVRAGAAQMLGVQAAEDASLHGLSFLSSLPKGAVVAGYWPIGDELDPRFLMQALSRAGYKTALPVVDGDNAPLKFRLWGQGDPLIGGPFGTQHPDDDAPSIVPAALLAPLLAFDPACYRLGWGGGFYDRTLAAHTSIQAFGFAYAAQFVEDMPRGQHDWPMQGVITEAGIILPKE
ncbi:MAG: 5-formyltetrahydrofolate cyclo-ligase [Kordiimonadaceae bacterium]|nr:5-formyltetrahydrofolate cyclo-ligase [Kordiimonadaceae bacterium]